MRCSNQCSEILAMHVRVVWTVLNNGLLFSSFLFWNMMNIFLPFLKNLPWIHDLKNLINHDPGREKNKNVFWSTSKCVRERHSLRQFLSPWKSFILCPFKIYLSKRIWTLFQIDKDCFLFASLTDRFQRWTSCYFVNRLVEREIKRGP